MFKIRKEAREKKIFRWIGDDLRGVKKIIDIGCGRGELTALLREKGKNVTPIDVDSYKYDRKIKDVILYDGEKIPFPENSFDTSLLITVLHHTKDPKIVFLEAARVAREVIIVETSYRNFLEKIYTVLIDTLINLQRYPFWNSYKKDEDWQEFFQKNGFRIISSRTHEDHILGIPYIHIVYYLKPETENS